MWNVPIGLPQRMMNISVVFGANLLVIPLFQVLIGNVVYLFVLLRQI